MNMRILVVASHPDDEVLGAGASIAKWSQSGHEVYTLILGEGVTSRQSNRDLDSNSDQLAILKSEMMRANEKLGVKEVFTENLPDNRFDQIDLLEVVKLVEKIIDNIKPELVLTHFKSDLNIDHQITNQAVLTATRPTPQNLVKAVWTFETLSATEWNYPLSFSPNLFQQVNQDQLECKVKAMQMYRSELRDYPHPRSLEGIRISAQNWGMKSGVQFAEAFQILRELRV